jgi:hypothetical protein
MVFPLFKVVMVLVKTTSKPLANFLKLMLKNQMMMQGMFVWVGMKANFKVAHPNQKATKDKIIVPEITND